MANKQVTIVDIAERAKLTHATVSRALRDNPEISEKTKQLVREVARSLGYRPNHAAKALKLGRTFTIGVVIPDFSNPYYGEFVKSVKRECEDKEYQVSVTECGMNADHELTSLERMLDKRFDGIIAFLTNFEEVKKTINEFWDRRIPFVGMGMPANDHTFKYDSVNGNWQNGYTKAVDHLVELGHKRISFVAGWLPKGHDTIYERYSFAIQRMLQKKMVVDEKRFIHNFTGNQVDDGIEIANRIINDIPDTTAVVCSNELVAMGLLRGFIDAGISVPNDISLVSTDNTWLGKNLTVPLTSIDLNSAEQAKAAVNLIWDRLGKKWDMPRHLYVESGLVARKSSARVRDCEMIIRE